MLAVLDGGVESYTCDLPVPTDVSGIVPEDVLEQTRDTVRETREAHLLFRPSNVRSERVPQALTVREWDREGDRRVLVPMEAYGTGRGSVMVVKKHEKRRGFGVAVNGVLLWTDEDTGLVVELTGVDKDEGSGAAGRIGSGCCCRSSCAFWMRSRSRRSASLSSPCWKGCC